MNELLKVVLSLSLSGTFLFFIILILKPLYKNKLCKRWQYYIWLIVVVRMLLPFSSETTLIGSVFEYLNNFNVETIQTALPANSKQSDFVSDDNYILPSTEPQASKLAIETAQSLSIQTIISEVYKNLWVLWVAIAFALLIRKITMYQSFVRFVKVGQAEVSDIEILNMLAEVGEIIGVKRSVELFSNPIISSPMLLGFFRPYIILPSVELDSTELVYIMQHELTHYKHLDMFYKWLVQITVCLHWFNPFVYLMAKEINKCCELSCDETIIKTMDKDEKKAYGNTLLNSLKIIGNYNDKLPTVTLTEGAEQLKERLDAIMKFKKTSKITVTIMLVLTLILAVGSTAIGAYAVPYQNNSPSSKKNNTLPLSNSNGSYGDKQSNKKNFTRQESLIINFAPFRSYGLVYNVEQDRVFFNGQEVKAFVDIREMFSGGSYSFNLGYIEPDSNSTLYLMAVRNEKGLVMGIQEMSKELKNDLYGIYNKTSLSEPYILGLEDEIKDNMSEILGSESGYSVHGEKYIVFNATTNLNDSSITATDKLNPMDIPKTIADWILTCQSSDEVNVKRTMEGGKIDAWIYYNSDTRLAWNMNTNGTILKFILTDNAPESVRGATLIHYQAPEVYQDLEVFLKSEKLKINIQ